MQADRSGAERLQQVDDASRGQAGPGRHRRHRFISPSFMNFTCVRSFAARAKSVDG